MQKQDIIILTIGVILAFILGAVVFYLQSMPNETNKTTEVRKEDANNPADYNAPEVKKGDLVAEINTNMGVIKIKLFSEDAPKTVENFKLLAERKYYDGVIFHRVIKDFMIQGGDPTGTGRGGKSAWGGKFEDEFSSKKNVYGALSMANAGPNTNGSQFFIVQNKEGTSWLNGKHTVFGQVYEGMNVVEDIASVQVGAGDKPVKDVIMNSVRVYEL